MAQIIAKFVERLECDRDSDKNAWLCNASCINIRQGQSFASASKRILNELTKKNTFELGFVMPQWNFEKIPRVPELLLHRYQVAIGLAKKDSDVLPLKALPHAFDSFWNMPEKKKNVSLLDLEELQANLYGR